MRFGRAGTTAVLLDGGHSRGALRPPRHGKTGLAAGDAVSGGATPGRPVLTEARRSADDGKHSNERDEKAHAISSQLVLAADYNVGRLPANRNAQGLLFLLPFGD